MYYLYRKSITGGTIRYDSPQESHLFGYKSGLIAKHLQDQLSTDSKEELGWHIPLVEILANSSPASTLIIDLKPKAGVAVSLCELLDVWGYSACGWTPIMFRAKILFMDDSRNCPQKDSFEIQSDIEKDIVYSFLHIEGTVKSGSIHGKWLAPSPSATNSALLWPKPLEYFMKRIAEFD